MDVNWFNWPMIQFRTYSFINFTVLPPCIIHIVSIAMDVTDLIKSQRNMTRLICLFFQSSNQGIF